MRNRKVLGTFILLASVLALTSVTVAAPPTDLHCPDGGSGHINIGAAGNDIALPAGTTFCVKAGTGNTGLLTADGLTTLQEYLFQSGIVDGSGEQGRDVSYYVTYTTGSTPTPEPSVDESISQETATPSLPDTATE